MVPDVYGMDDVGCSGRESSIRACSHLSQDTCGGWEGAGVVCTMKGNIKNNIKFSQSF